MKRIACLLLTFLSGCVDYRLYFARFESCEKPGRAQICKNADGTFGMRLDPDIPKCTDVAAAQKRGACFDANGKLQPPPRTERFGK